VQAQRRGRVRPRTGGARRGLSGILTAARRHVNVREYKRGRQRLRSEDQRGGQAA
jgi:hypothetical protein